MLRSAGLWRALLHRIRSDWPVVLAAGLLLLCATTLLAAGSVYGDVVALGGMRQAILDAPPEHRVVVISSSAAPGDVGALDDVITEEATEVLGDGGGEIGFVATSAAFERRQAADAPLVRLGAYRGIADHAELIEGAWPAAAGEPIEGALSEGAAEALGLGVGDTLFVGSRDTDRDIELRIVGLWRPDRDDPYWLAKAQELDGVEVRGPFTTVGTRGPRPRGPRPPGRRPRPRPGVAGDPGHRRDPGRRAQHVER